jgi:hypothetical protein
MKRIKEVTEEGLMKRELRGSHHTITLVCRFYVNATLRFQFHQVRPMKGFGMKPEASREELVVIPKCQLSTVRTAVLGCCFLSFNALHAYPLTSDPHPEQHAGEKRKGRVGLQRPLHPLHR